MSNSVQKAPTGIEGFDEISLGGLPRGRATLVCGSPGSGKSLFAAEFLARGAVEFGEPGVLISFEETADEITRNVASLGFNLNSLIRRKKLALDHVRVERSEIQETGEFDLEGLFVRIAHAADSVRAKRIAIDTIEGLFTGFSNQAILRAEIRRLFGFLKSRGLTAVITGEAGHGTLTRQGLEEYVSDCVVALDQRVTDQVSTRRLRIVKYRGSSHATNEFPFIIGVDGMSVLPITSVALNHRISNRCVSSGVREIDDMLGRKGFYEGSSVLISGGPGSGKSSLASAFVESVCDSGRRAILVAHEESAFQVVRNMRSIGIRLGRHLASGRLKIHAVRPSLYGLESHLVQMHRLVRDERPAALVIDPVTSFEGAASASEVNALLVRMVDFLKTAGITSLMTDLTDRSDPGRGKSISSIMDTWISLSNDVHDGSRRRFVDVIKSRGMNHSTDLREFVLTSRGVRMAPTEDQR